MTVGWKKKPFSRPAGRARSPPMRNFPLPLAVATSDSTRSSWAAETSGPMSVDAEAGSPTRNLADKVDQAAEETLVDGLLHVDARGGGTVLAGIDEATDDGTLRRRL